MNRELKITYLASKLNFYDNFAIDDIIIKTNDQRIILQVKEIALFGHDRDLEELWGDYGSVISLNGHYN